MTEQLHFIHSYRKSSKCKWYFFWSLGSSETVDWPPIDQVIGSAQYSSWAFQVALVVKNLPASAGDTRDMDLTPGSGRSPGGGHGNPLQCCCLENPMDRGAWWATVYGVAKSWDMTEATQHIRMQYSYYLIYINGLRNIAVSYKKAHLTISPTYSFKSFVIPPQVIYTVLGEFSLVSVRKTAQSTLQFPLCSPLLLRFANQQ